MIAKSVLSAVALAAAAFATVAPARAQSEPACAANSQVKIAKLGVNACGTAVAGDTGHAALFIYSGIRYAKAARWENPLPWKPDGDIKATRPGAICPQFAGPGESEDCLFLNVYAPQDAIKGTAKNLPVMVFIHGGAFVTGAGSELNGTKLAQKGAVVVTLNYRLGALGFMASGGGFYRESSGNFGIVDQQTAMTWVHDNVADFGGNPGNITLFGESAGAMSVGLHVFDAPDSAGLFSAAIMESNPLGIVYLSRAKAIANGNSFLNALCGLKVGCAEKASIKDIIAAQTNYLPVIFSGAAPLETAPAVSMSPLRGLGVPPPSGLAQAPRPRAASAADINEVLGNVASNPFQFQIQSLPWQPYIDGRVIAGQPLNGYNDSVKKMPRIPVAFGVNSDEGVLFAIMVNDIMHKALKTRIDASTYNAIVATKFKDQKDAIRKIARYNPDEVELIRGFNTGIAAFANLMTDYSFLCANIKLADNLLAQQGAQPVYGYLFSQRPFFDVFVFTAAPGQSPADHYACAPEHGKVCHANELPYVFNLMDDFEHPDIPYHPKKGDRELAEQMTAAWFAFAKDPHSPGDGWVKYGPEPKMEKIWEFPRRVGAPKFANLDASAHCSAIWLTAWPYRSGDLP